MVSSDGRSSSPSPEATAAEVKRYMNALLEVSLASASTLDPREQARAALTALTQTLDADRGFLFLTDALSGELSFHVGCAADGTLLESASGHSTTAVRQVAETREPVAVAGMEDEEVLRTDSAIVHGLRSIAAAPLLMRDRFIGVVYIDNRISRGLFSNEELKMLVAIANHIAIALETGRAARLEAERRALERDLALTGAVQSLLLPRADVTELGWIAVAGHYKPATHCGGDWWWWELRDDGSLLVLVGDVVGHGAGSAMVTAAVAGSCRALRPATAGLDGGEILTSLDNVVADVAGDGYHMTMSAMQIEPRAGRLTWWNAAGPSAFIQRASGGLEHLVSPGTPLGGRELKLGRVETSLDAGDRLLISTDGVFEVVTEEGKPLGPRRVANLLGTLMGLPTRSARDMLASQLDALRGPAAPDDDVTFVIVDRL